MKMDVTSFSKDKIESTEGIKQTGKFGMAKDAQKMVFSIFTKSLYSNPIGSIVREITSNSFDSHQEAKVTDPVEITFVNENNQFYINFKDVGVGMSYERITTIFAEYFNSTKRDDNDLIGGYGIGGKTPLAYSESFYLITIYDGWKYIWCIYKGEESPLYDLMAKESTNERNGTTVKVPIKNKDYDTFESEMFRQLYYFENIIFNNFSSKLENEYTIYRATHFMYRGENYSKRMHICLGRVAYPIDFSAVGLNESEYNFPIALKFDIGDLEVTPSRETIQYTESTIKTIKKKLELAKDEIHNMLLNQYKNISSLREYYKVKEQFGNLILDAEKNIVIVLGNLIKSSELTYPKLSLLAIPDSTTLTSLICNCQIVGKRQLKSENPDSLWNKDILTMKNWNYIYHIDNGVRKDNRVQSYLKNNYLRYFFVSPSKHLSNTFIDSLETYSLSNDKNELLSSNKQMGQFGNKLIDLRNQLSKNNKVSKDFFIQLRLLIAEVNEMILEDSIAYSSIIVPSDYVIYKRNEFNKAMLDRKMSVVSLGGRKRVNRHITTFRDLMNFKGTIIYGSREDDQKIIDARELCNNLNITRTHEKFDFLNKNTSHRSIGFNKTTLVFVSHLKNAIHHSEVYDKLIVKKKKDILITLQNHAFRARYNKINSLFFNKALINVDNTLKKHTTKLLIAYKRSSEGNVTLSGLDYKRLNIDTNTFKSGYDQEFEYIEAQDAKNEMIKYVNIPSHTNASISPKLMELINLVYKK